jgi:hypothetical protein
MQTDSIFIAILTVLCFVGVAFAQQAAKPVAPAKQVCTQAKPPTSEQTSKNIQAHKGISPWNGLSWETMGVMFRRPML